MLPPPACWASFQRSVDRRIQEHTRWLVVALLIRLVQSAIDPCILRFSQWWCLGSPVNMNGKDISLMNFKLAANYICLLLKNFLKKVRFIQSFFTQLRFISRLPSTSVERFQVTGPTTPIHTPGRAVAMKPRDEIGTAQWLAQDYWRQFWKKDEGWWRSYFYEWALLFLCSR